MKKNNDMTNEEKRVSELLKVGQKKIAERKEKLTSTDYICNNHHCSFTCCPYNPNSK